MKAEEILEIIVKHIKRKIKVSEMIRLMEAAKEIESHYKHNNLKQCMYCEKIVDYSTGIFTCEDCSK